MYANKCAPGVDLAGAGITRRRRSSWQRVAVAVAAAPARVPVLAVVKAAAVEAEGRAQATPAAGQARLGRYRVATGRTRHRPRASNASCNGTCNGCNALQVAAPNRSGTLSIPIKAHCKPLRWALHAREGILRKPSRFLSGCDRDATRYPTATEFSGAVIDQVREGVELCETRRNTTRQC